VFFEGDVFWQPLSSCERSHRPVFFLFGCSSDYCLACVLIADEADFMWL
jgi:hypothetical protein